jgi:hypothetical protein
MEKARNHSLIFLCAKVMGDSLQFGFKLKDEPKLLGDEGEAHVVLTNNELKQRVAEAVKDYKGEVEKLKEELRALKAGPAARDAAVAGQ